jgi:hypothetical protein
MKVGWSVVYLVEMTVAAKAAWMVALKAEMKVA